MPILIVSNTWKSTAEIQSYISQYLGQSHRLKDDQSCKLIGRVRPVALFVEQCLLRFDEGTFNDSEYFEDFYMNLTKPSISQWSLYYLFDESRFRQQHDLSHVMEILKKAVYFQLCFGFPYVLNVDSDARLFEYAFGILYEENMPSNFEMKIVINEPFILQTAYNKFSETCDFLQVTAEKRIGESFIASSRGFLWEVSLQGYLCFVGIFSTPFP